MAFACSENGRRYAWEQLLARAGMDLAKLRPVGLSLETLPVFYEDPLDMVTLKGPALVIRPAAADSFVRLLDLPADSLSRLPATDLYPEGRSPVGAASLPILLWGEGIVAGEHPVIEQSAPRVIIFNLDIIAATFFMLSRWEETQAETFDEHGRFPFQLSIAARQGILIRPLVDEYALLLRAWLRWLLPEWRPRRRPFQVRLTHDIDVIFEPHSWPKTMRKMGRLLLNMGSPGRVWGAMMAPFHSRRTPERDPYFQGLLALLDLAEQSGLKAHFYFMASAREPLQAGYDPSAPGYAEIFRMVAERGHQLGIHPGYYAFDDEAELRRQIARWSAAIDWEGPLGGRNHYLRFRAPESWRLWEQVGLSYDSSLGYARHEGFRAGTCHPFQPFDIAADSILDVVEYPLIVMDVTLKKYRGLEPAQASQVLRDLVDQCCNVEGDFTLLWHNTSLHGGWGAWRPLYEDLLTYLASKDGQLLQQVGD